VKFYIIDQEAFYCFQIRLQKFCLDCKQAAICGSLGISGLECTCFVTKYEVVEKFSQHKI